MFVVFVCERVEIDREMDRSEQHKQDGMFKKISDVTGQTVNNIKNSLQPMVKKVTDATADFFDPYQASFSDSQASYQDPNGEILTPNIIDLGLPSTNDPVWICGKSFNAQTEKEAVYDEIEKRFWFTYRKYFSPIEPSQRTTDAGWGCMIRCGQMMFADALRKMNLGEDFSSLKDKRFGEPKWKRKYFEVLARFMDNKACLYSIHRISMLGESEGKEVGDWFGPNTVAQVMKKLAHYDSNPKYEVFIGMDNILVTEDVYQLCKKDGEWKPLIFIMPLRLGLSTLNPQYIDALKECFQFPQSLGCIGGRPDHALWFYGYVENDLLCFDPHTTQQSVNLDGATHQNDFSSLVDMAQRMDPSSFHFRSIRRIPFSSMDPSMALGFLCETEESFERVCARLKQTVLRTPPFMFEIYETVPQSWRSLAVEESFSDEGSSSNAMEQQRNVDPAQYDDEFEILG